MGKRGNSRRVSDLAVYAAFLVVRAVLKRLPLELTFQLGETIGTVAHALAGHYRRLAQANVRIAFPDWEEREVRRCVRRHFQTLTANVLCSLPMGEMTDEEVRRHVDLAGFEACAEYAKAHGATVLLLNHLSNWELMIHATRWLPPGAHAAIYQPLRNPWLDRAIVTSRRNVGLELIDRSAGLQRALGILRGGGCLGILIDQHAGDHGVWTPFFDRLASTTPFPAILAKKTGAPLVVVSVVTVGPARWRVETSEFIDPRSGSIEEITSRGNELLAEQIRKRPSDGFWVHRRWKTPSPQFLLRRYKRGVYVPPPFRRSGALRPFRIVVRSSNWLGDAVMTVPAVRAIKAGRPDAHVTVLTKTKLADFWRAVPEVDAILAIEPGQGVWAVARALRAARFDAAILLPNSPRSGLEAWLAGIGRRVGYARPWRTWSLNVIVPEKKRPGPPVHQAEGYLRIAERIGGLRTDARPVPRRRAPERGHLALCPGAEYGPAKRWLGFAEAAALLSERHDLRWSVVGTANDRAHAQPIVDRLGPRATDLTGKTSLAELMAALERCELLLTNDTGTMHLAAHLGVPTVSVFGSTEPALTGPLGGGHVVVRHHVECSPCFLRECPIDFRCMREVTVDEVVRAVEGRLGARS